MPRALRSDKFFVYTAQKSGCFKKKMLLGINSSYKGGAEDISLQDLIDFLEEKKIGISSVKVPAGFITVAQCK